MNEEEKMMLAQISKVFGSMGITGIQKGSMFIPVTAPATVTECVGAGDTIRIGDVVIDQRRLELKYPHRIEAIFPSNTPGIGPTILSREIDADPIFRGPTSYCAWGSDWCRDFKVLDQAAVDAWFVEAKAIRKDGWHKLPDFRGRVLISEGIPIEIERGSEHQPLKMAVAAAEQMLGFDITPCRTYANKSKLNMKVKRAVRRQPPTI